MLYWTLIMSINVGRETSRRTGQTKERIAQTKLGTEPCSHLCRHQTRDTNILDDDVTVVVLLITSTQCASHHITAGRWLRELDIDCTAMSCLATAAVNAVSEAIYYDSACPGPVQVLAITVRRRATDGVCWPMLCDHHPGRSPGTRCVREPPTTQAARLLIRDVTAARRWRTDGLLTLDID